MVCLLDLIALICLYLEVRQNYPTYFYLVNPVLPVGVNLNSQFKNKKVLYQSEGSVVDMHSNR